ncbi:HAMP domain-containing histidine kinase [Mitsuaria sp. WAJ17]|uniref:sensor histidine kinase n=1 Tax=Mitsuaria sp. WAJ17 TaxID=2761452 RepID=UPI0016049011|nr:HAMP domain-containing sensor histidine kinase [Mitsuaria sp. WAJ17]MBB2486442.1 HAMP domain-containing histidine kinase [Mitsuaria sp. WAJ17]
MRYPAWHWLRPSLARRLVTALLLAFALVALTLLGQSYVETRQQMATNPGIRQLGELMAATVAQLDEGPLAAQAVAGLADHINGMRRQARRLPGEVVVQLFDAQGRLVYANLAADPIQRLGVSEQSMAGRQHWTWRGDGPRWSVRLAEPTLPELTMLAWMAGELGPQMLLAFPFVLLPVLLAVYSGLRPLRQFAHRLDQVESEPAPLAMNLRYAELQPLGRAFDALQERLRLRMARERAFVQDAAHELRTPLAVIAAQTHVLVQAAHEPVRQEAGERLLAAIRRTSHLSQQLLDLAALDGKAERQRQRLDLVLSSAQLLADLHGRARERGLALALEAPEQLPRELDAAAFLSVLHNLLDNALRYVQAGGQVLLTLAADGPEGGEGWTLTVSDDGPGIAEADRELVFERFWRGPEVETPGSGLGLAIVRQAARRLGGQVSLTAGLGGRGCAFTLRVPGAPPAFGSS